MGWPTDHTQVQVCDTHWEGKVLGQSQIQNTEQINESQRRNQHYEYKYNSYKMFFSNMILSNPSGGGYVKSKN